MKRIEEFAGLALNGLLAKTGYTQTGSTAVRQAWELADEMEKEALARDRPDVTTTSPSSETELTGTDVKDEEG